MNKKTLLIFYGLFLLRQSRIARTCSHLSGRGWRRRSRRCGRQTRPGIEFNESQLQTNSFQKQVMILFLCKFDP
jgi:hypothetical protein